MSKLTPFNFFLKYAGFSYDPKTETEQQGQMRCAQELADAERRAYEQDVTFEWGIDRSTSSADFSDDEPAYALWYCIMHDADDNPLDSLFGIDFGPDGDEHSDPTGRVIEAELALGLPE